MGNTNTVTLAGDFYKVITVKVDLLESRVVDERHFATEAEAKEHQAHTIIDGDNSIYCFVVHMG